MATVNCYAPPIQFTISHNSNNAHLKMWSNENYLTHAHDVFKGEWKERSASAKEWERERETHERYLKTMKIKCMILNSIQMNFQSFIIARDLFVLVPLLLPLMLVMMMIEQFWVIYFKLQTSLKVIDFRSKFLSNSMLILNWFCWLCVWERVRDDELRCKNFTAVFNCMPWQCLAQHSTAIELFWIFKIEAQGLR